MVQKYIFSWYYEHEFKFHKLTRQLHLGEGLFRLISGFKINLKLETFNCIPTS